MPKFEVDAEGKIKNGRFQGRHIDEVMQYLEGLEEAVTHPSNTPPADPTTPPTNTPPTNDPPPNDPNENLRRASAARMDPLQIATIARLEADDEESFARDVPDYEKYREAIKKLKDQTVAPHLRAMKGLHRTLYINVKSNDPKVMKRITREVPQEDVDDDNAPLAVPPAAEPPVNRAPAAAPPAFARPTPAARQPAASGDRKPKLIASGKIVDLCRRTNQNVDAYLIRLEDRGVTQAEIDNSGQVGRTEAPRSVYDRPRVVRS